ncbi:MAG: glycosyltransferase family protein [Bacteroidales bacterium]|jgi:spore coat polysaccharide biosynthesis protein SpsF|nr:glycosyltransferase family protein [Bacteroidales bacterium]
MVKAICIVQARLTSSRLPDKVLKLLGREGKTILEHVYDRLLLSTNLDKIIFAIPDTESNDYLFDFLQQKEIPTFRGSEDNVLSRYYECAKKYSPQIIVRATCDNPLVDWTLIDMAIQMFINNTCDYVNMKGYPLGTGTEVFSWKSLQIVYSKVEDKSDKEHVTPFFYKNPDIFSISTLQNVVYQTNKYRLTVDTEEDYELMKIIYNELYNGTPVFNKSVMDFLDKHPELLSINDMIEQKSAVS